MSFRWLPAAVPVIHTAGWVALLAARPIPAVIDWRIILFVAVLSGLVMGLLALPLIFPDRREWGLGAAILAAMLAPLGASITVLSLFSYVAGDLSPGWEQSETAIPALAVQVATLAAIAAGLFMQQRNRAARSHTIGRWMVLGGTLLGSTALAVHLYAVAFDVV